MTRADRLRCEISAMVWAAWAEHGRALNYAMWARQAEADAFMAKCDRWRAVSLACRTHAHKYIAWARQKRAELEQLHAMTEAANDA